MEYDIDKLKMVFEQNQVYLKLYKNGTVVNNIQLMDTNDECSLHDAEHAAHSLDILIEAEMSFVHSSHFRSFAYDALEHIRYAIKLNRKFKNINDLAGNFEAFKLLYDLVLDKPYT